MSPAPITERWEAVGAFLFFVLVLLLWRWRLNIQTRILKGAAIGQGFDGQRICHRMDGRTKKPGLKYSFSRGQSRAMEGARKKISRMRFFRRLNEGAEFAVDGPD